MSDDTLGKVADFVRVGQAAQAAVDKLAPRRVDRDRAQLAMDALAIGGRVGELVRLLDDAAALRVQRRHANAATFEQLARAELRVLAGLLDAHFRRFAGASRYACTCGYTLEGAELAAFLETCGSATPASMVCPKCDGVAVRMSS